MNSILKTAFKSRLTAGSLWALPTRQRARENYRLFIETIFARNDGTSTPKSLLVRIYMANQKIVWCQFITAIGAVVFHYANPFFLRKLLNFIQEHHHQSDNMTEEEKIGYLYCVALFICNAVSTLVASQTLLWGRRWHVTITQMLNSEIYAKALKLKSVNYNKKNQQSDDEEDDEVVEEEERGNDETAHQQASLMSQDTERLAELASYLHVRYVQKGGEILDYPLTLSFRRSFIRALWKLQQVSYFYIRFWEILSWQD